MAIDRSRFRTFGLLLIDHLQIKERGCYLLVVYQRPKTFRHPSHMMGTKIWEKLPGEREKKKCVMCILEPIQDYVTDVKNYF
jgi:hypothetical protein